MSWLSSSTALSTNLRKTAWLDFFAGGDDLDNGHKPVATHVSHRDDVLLATIELQVGLAGQSSFRSGDDHAPVIETRSVAERYLLLLVMIARRSGLERQNIRPKMRGVLLGQRVMVWGKNPAIEQPLDLLDPGVMEVVEDAGINPRPVVSRHG
jgi:hypothetical protein